MTNGLMNQMLANEAAWNDLTVIMDLLCKERDTYAEMLVFYLSRYLDLLDRQEDNVTDDDIEVVQGFLDSLSDVKAQTASQRVMTALASRTRGQ